MSAHPDPTQTDEYVAFILDGAKTAYERMPKEMRTLTLEEYQANVLRERGVLKWA